MLIPGSGALRMTQLLPLWCLLRRIEIPIPCCHLGQGTGPKLLIGWHIMVGNMRGCLGPQSQSPAGGRV